LLNPRGEKSEKPLEQLRTERWSYRRGEREATQRQMWSTEKPLVGLVVSKLINVKGTKISSREKAWADQDRKVGTILGGKKKKKHLGPTFGFASDKGGKGKRTKRGGILTWTKKRNRTRGTRNTVPRGK